MQLRSLVDFTNEKTITNSCWPSFLKSSLFEKFGQLARPNFKPFVVTPDYKKDFSQFSPLYPTMTATYLLGMKYMYLDLSSIQVLEPDKVKTLFITAGVVELSSDVVLPGNSNVIIICNQFIARSNGNRPLTITVSVDPLNKYEFQLIAENTLGTFKLRSNKWKDGNYATVYNAVTLILTESSIDNVMTVGFGSFNYSGLLPSISTANFLYKPTSEIYGNEWIITSFRDALHYFLVCIENILNYEMDAAASDSAILFADWITRSLKESIKLDSNFGETYVRLMALVKTRNPTRTKRPVFVPYLTYIMYEKTINALVDLAQEYGTMKDGVQQRIEEQRLNEEIAENQQILNKNIQNIGKFLLGQNKAIRAQEKDFADYYNQIVADKQASLKTALGQQQNLEAELVKQQYVLDVTQQKLKTAMENKIGEELFQAAVQVATTCVDLFTENVFKIPEDLKGLIKTVQKVKKAVEAIESFAEMLQAVTTGKAFDKAINGFNKIPYKSISSVFPTELDWFKFNSDVEKLMNQIGVSEAGDFVREAKMLTAIGKQYTSISQRICDLQYEISLNMIQANIHSKQNGRLDDLENQLNQPSLTTDEAMNIDLFNLGTTLQSSQQTVLLRLMDILQEQEGALQYYTLQSPTPLTRYDILSVKDAIASRALKALRAFQSFVPPPHELEELRHIKIPLVPFSSLNASGFNFRIKLDTTTFLPYVRVRITEIQAYIEDVTTSTGALHVKISGGGSNFLDRGLERQLLEYATYPHIYPFSYNVGSGKVIAGNRLTGEDLKTFNLMTPSTLWNIQTPVNASERLKKNMSL